MSLIFVDNNHFDYIIAHVFILLKYNVNAPYQLTETRDEHVLFRAIIDKEQDNI